MLESEEVNENSLLQATIKNYIRTGIREYTGLNLTDFLELPRDIVEMITELCDQQSNKKEATIASIEKQFRHD